MNNYRKLVNTYEKDIKIIPAFININNEKHKKLRNLMVDVYLTQAELFVAAILTRDRIDFLHDSILVLLEDMFDIDDVVTLKFIGYDSLQMDFYMGLAAVTECYEAAENIKKFNEINGK